jgi:hypothetical protein
VESRQAGGKQHESWTTKQGAHSWPMASGPSLVHRKEWARRGCEDQMNGGMTTIALAFNQPLRQPWRVS